ncbi:transposon-encoded TnpW family protein [Lawsonibacter sp. LCP25S3_F5]
MNTNTTQTTAQHTQPCYRKTIDKTTYVVRVHFNEDTKETMADKIKRMLREEVRNM